MAAMGAPDSVILRGAGAYKLYKDYRKGIPDPYGRPWDPDPNSYFGNEPQKQEMISKGINYYRSGCTQSPSVEPFGQPWAGELP